MQFKVGDRVVYEPSMAPPGEPPVRTERLIGTVVDVMDDVPSFIFPYRVDWDEEKEVQQNSSPCSGRELSPLVLNYEDSLWE